MLNINKDTFPLFMLGTAPFPSSKISLQGGPYVSSNVAQKRIYRRILSLKITWMCVCRRARARVHAPRTGREVTWVILGAIK